MNKRVCTVTFAIVAVIAAVFLILYLRSQPSNTWSDEAVDSCLYTISIIEDVIDGNMEADVAKAKIERIEKELDDGELHNSIMSTHIGVAGSYVSMYGFEYSTVTKRDLQEQIDTLKNALYH